MTRFNILYKGRKIYQDLTHEECAEVLDEISSKYYTDEEFNIELLELEEI
jgi:hypothetical protein